ncbi:MAG: alpha-galactosidase [Coriobacteriales bacterium]|nr:alpha-galactosidase [Coriobacteriales bacterium]
MSVGPIIRIVYHVPGIDRRREVVVGGDGTAAGGNDARELGVVVAGNERVRRVYVQPDVAVVVDEVVATLELAIGEADAIYLNGYNSWTDSVERPVGGRMRGLSRVPRRVVDKYVLDASGDYRFVEEDTRVGHQHGFGYGYVRQGDEVLLFGSLNEDNGFTLIREDLDVGTIMLHKEVPQHSIHAGQRRELMVFALVGGTLEHAVDEWLALAGIQARPARPLVGYTSWYRHYGDIDVWKLEEDLFSTSLVLRGMVVPGADCVFQVDDGYAKVGDWLEYDRARFPQGLRDLASRARGEGLLPGLWLAPFVCERNSRIFAEHPEWLLKDEHGDLVTTGSQWSGAVALDIRNDDVRTYVGKVLHTVTQDWGFGLLKLDFLYAACLVPHDGLNRGELMADALELLRNNVNDDTRLLLCGVPLMSAFGRCEYCRIGPDVGLDWDDMPHMRLLHRERVSTKRSLANARGRAHLDGRAFRCDPDVLFLREEGVSLSADQRAQMLATDTSCGGVLFTSDSMTQWNTEQLDAYHAAVDRFAAYNGLT